MAGVDPDPGPGVAGLHPGEFARMAHLQQQVLGGVDGAHPRLLGRAGAGRLLVLGDVTVGEPDVLLDVAGAQRLVRRQVVPGEPAVVLHVTVLDAGVLRGVAVDELGRGSRVFERHGAHLAWPGYAATVPLADAVRSGPVIPQRP